jgi:hypothetical protein
MLGRPGAEKTIWFGDSNRTEEKSWPKKVLKWVPKEKHK